MKITVLGESPVPEEIIIARKRETESVSGTTYVDIAGLGAILKAGASYLVHGQILMTAGGTGGAKFSFRSGASEHILRTTMHDWIAPENSVSFLTLAQETDTAAALPAGDHAFSIEGSIVGAVDGPFKIIGAQNSANSSLAIYAGSYLEFTRIK